MKQIIDNAFDNPFQSYFLSSVAALLLLTILSLNFLKWKSQPTKHTSKDEILPPFAPSGIRETLTAMFGNEAPRFFLKHARSIGTIYRLRMFSGTTVVAVCDPIAARQILNDAKSTKPLSVYMFSDLALDGDNFFSAEGVRWKHARKAVAPAFSSLHVERMKHVCKSILDTWISTRLEPKVGANESFDPLYEMQYITIKIIAEAGFEYDITDDEVDTILLSFDTIYDAQRKLTNPIYIWFKWCFKDQRLAKKSTADLLSIAHRILKCHREHPNPSDGTVISFLNGNKEYNSDDERARDLLIFLAGGYDSTSAALAWALLELAKNPHEQEILRNDLNNSNDDYSQSSALKHVIRESFRLNPTAAFGPVRVVSKNMEFGSFTIPKDSIAIMPLFAIHRNADVFEDPDSFQPGRWNEASDIRLSSVMPYAIGRRNCIGQALANAELDVILARLCANYEFTVVQEGTDDHFVILKRVGMRLLANKMK